MSIYHSAYVAYTHTLYHTPSLNKSFVFQMLFIKQFGLERKTTARFIKYSIKFSMSILHFNKIINGVFRLVYQERIHLRFRFMKIRNGDLN